MKALEEKGLLFVGSGVSGGEDGARYGPSLMPGGSPKAWPHIKDIFQGISAKVGTEPCCDWVSLITVTTMMVMMIYGGGDDDDTSTKIIWNNDDYGRQIYTQALVNGWNCNPSKLYELYHFPEGGTAPEENGTVRITGGYNFPSSDWHDVYIYFISIVD